MIRQIYIYNSCLGSITRALYVNHPGQDRSCIKMFHVKHSRQANEANEREILRARPTSAIF